MKQREQLASRLGFILLSAGCAIGLGNVWRFPYITGLYGGAAFVLIYLIFLVIFGLPIMVMEFAVGRASQKSVAQSFYELQPKNSKWHLYGYFAMAGNYLLMMFYTTIAGWMLYYLLHMLKGDLSSLNPEQVGAFFGGLVSNPVTLTIYMIVVVILGFGVCAIGLRKGVERITKLMMSCLLLIMIFLAIYVCTLPNAQEGISFYLLPNFPKLLEQGVGNVIFAAMGQAFFTLSLGIGSMAIFGSYIGKDRSLMGESIVITGLDTFVAIVAGLIIFPACSAFGVDPGSGPGLVFVTLPNIFNEMPGGQIFGTMFFVFMSFAAFTTVIAVFENLVSFGMDLFNWSRRKSSLINIVAIIILSMPCILGFNVLSGFNPLGGDSIILDLEDFIVSNNLLPLGSLIYLLFCTSRYGWGWDNFIAEADSGKGVKFPRWIRFYVSYVLPFILLAVFINGYIEKFFS